MRHDIPLDATIQELFEEFVRETIGELPQDSFARKELERAFYSGFGSMFGIVWTIAHETEGNRQRRKEVLETLDCELCDFARKVVAEVEAEENGT